jgi:putative spermidine/putrescine transport system ATP-binding protein
LSATPAVRLENLSCVFHTGQKSVHAVDNISLEIAPSEFFSLLGPSGSGKTTCLRLIGGFERPSSGKIELFGSDASHKPPFLRELNTVFQDYALFPHMNVLENVAYALMVRGVGKAERFKQASSMLEAVKLSGFGTRRPAQLSGGQRQRVALARALVNRPKILLLDEPLGALDLKLREEMQIELKTLQRDLGITFIYVTHDQGEALSMSDRVAVFNNGKIEQLDAPKTLYNAPRTEFVARFVGSANVFDGGLIGQPGLFALRPENIRVLEPSGSGLVGQILDIHFLGAQTRLEVQVGETRIASLHSAGQNNANQNFQRGDQVRLAWDNAHLLRLEGQA